MNKSLLSASAFVLCLGFSSAALAAAHYYEVIGEGYGHTRDEAIDAASYYASQKCYLSWGESTREQRILVDHVDAGTGYWYVKLAEGCVSYD